MAETYEQAVACTNCEFKETIAIPKGETADDQQCPNCGNESLRRFIPPTSYR